MLIIAIRDNLVVSSSICVWRIGILPNPPTILWVLPAIIICLQFSLGIIPNKVQRYKFSTSIGEYASFAGVDKNECTLYVPQESLDAYKSAAVWKDFFNITTGIKDAAKSSATATEEARYSTDGTRLASPQKGINIIRMSDGTVKKVLVK